MSPIEMLGWCEALIKSLIEFSLRPLCPHRLNQYKTRLEAIQCSKTTGTNCDFYPLLQGLISKRPQAASLISRALALSDRFDAEYARLMGLLSGVEALSDYTKVPAKRAIDGLFNACAELVELALANELLPLDTEPFPERADSSGSSLRARTFIRAEGSEFAGMSEAEVQDWMRWADFADRDNNRAGTTLECASAKAMTIVQMGIVKLAQHPADGWIDNDSLTTLAMLEGFLAATAALQECARILAATARNLGWTILAEEVDPLAQPVA